MRTVISKASAASISQAASLIREGNLVAFPTETVYGLGANALDSAAVRTIFSAKGRPADNPLIVHVASKDMLDQVVTRVSPKARTLIERFWPGPLTILFEAKKSVPRVVRAGLPTVAVRMPSNPVALALIRNAGVPLAAPSANRSGKPSPTTAAHVYDDLAGKIPLILDGGPCTVGVESTVIDVSRSPAVVLRPGAITIEQLRLVIGSVKLATARSAVRAPGMKYTHYAPKAKIVLVERATPAKLEALSLEYRAWGEKVIVFRAGELTAKNLYAKLRAADARGFSLLVIAAPKSTGEDAALWSRLSKAATRIVN